MFLFLYAVRLESVIGSALDIFKLHVKLPDDIVLNRNTKRESNLGED